MNNMCRIFVILTAFLISGCISSPSGRLKILNENVNIFVKEMDAWYDLMPPVEAQNNNFKFFVDLNVGQLENSYIQMDTTNFSISEFNVKFNNYTVKDKRFELEKSIINANTFSLRITQKMSGEKYLVKGKPDPAEVTFEFDLNYDGEFLRHIKTNNISIKKVY